MIIQLTDNERAVLAHVVMSPDGWCASAVLAHGEIKAIADMKAKVKKHQQNYDDAVLELGEEYKNRYEREADNE